MTYFTETGRAPVMAKNGMAATSHPRASEVAIEILKAGGNAMDAAVAACAVQCVVEPQSTGIGGDCFAIYSPSGGIDYHAYNGSGRAPAAAQPEWFKTQGITEIGERSPHAVTVPGAVDAWDRLISDHGRMSLAELLAPAIKFARDGYKIEARVAADFWRNRDCIETSSPAAKVFKPDGMMPKFGDVHRQLLLAQTLQIIGAEGRDGFYRGAVADDIVTYLQNLGGLHTLEDFGEARGEYVKPIKANFRGYDIFQCPPNGQGIIALMLLKIIERFDRGGVSPMDAERVHREIETGRLGYHYRDAYLADPIKADVPVDAMLSAETIDRLFKAIGDKKTASLSDYDLPDHQDTVYISVVDKDRNCASFINTLFMSFGSGLMAPKTGVMLHNRGRGFTLQSGHPNEIAGNKRPLHTIIPGMVAKNGKTIMPFGVMGGAYQAFGHMQFLSRLFDYGYDIQAAMDVPRFFPNPVTGKVEVEPDMDDDLLQDIVGRGHDTVPSPIPIGGSQAIWIDWDAGMLLGGSDPRKDGCAVGY